MQNHSNPSWLARFMYTAKGEHHLSCAEVATQEVQV
jgi:hypothetical protein